MYTPAKVLGAIILCALIALGIWAVFIRTDSAEPVRVVDVSTFENRLELQWIKVWAPDFSMGYGMRLYSPNAVITSDITVDMHEPVSLFVSLFNDNPYPAHSRLLVFLNGRPVTYSVDGAAEQDFYSHQLPPGGIINIPVEVDISKLEHTENKITFLYLHYLDDMPARGKHIPHFTSAITRRLLIPDNAEGAGLEGLNLTATVAADPDLAKREQVATLLNPVDEIPGKQITPLTVAPGLFSLSISAYDPNPVLYATWFFVDDEPVWLEGEQPCLVWKSGLDVMLHRTVTLPSPPKESASLYAVSIPLDCADERCYVMSSEKIELLIQN